MRNVYVIDSCALISYFNEILIGSDISISKRSLGIIDRAFCSDDIKLIFPSTVFIELFKKWFKSEEDAERIKVEIYSRISSRANMEIQPFDREVLENFMKIKDIEPDHNFDNHDKQILAAAMTMECALISSDRKIIRYNKRKGVIPEILN